MSEATINPDGTTDVPPNTNETFTNSTFSSEEILAPPKTTDPAVYFGIIVIIIGLITFLIYRKRKKNVEEDGSDEFFQQLDGEKFNLKLPNAVDEYYSVKDKIIEEGWTPGQKDASGPTRVLQQALMKRCIADIPLVTHIQKESAGMNKLYSHSMCSVKQWRTYQAAEAMVSAEVDEVRAEADEIEPGWSEYIWRQAMQYHNMLKQRHAAEEKAVAEKAQKIKLEQDKVLAITRAEDEAKARIVLAEKTAQELIKQEEREQDSKTAFNNGKIKKGFLVSGGKKK